MQRYGWLIKYFRWR